MVRQRHRSTLAARRWPRGRHQAATLLSEGGVVKPEPDHIPVGTAALRDPSQLRMRLKTTPPQGTTAWEFAQDPPGG